MYSFICYRKKKKLRMLAKFAAIPRTRPWVNSLRRFSRNDNRACLNQLRAVFFGASPARFSASTLVYCLLARICLKSEINGSFAFRRAQAIILSVYVLSVARCHVPCARIQLSYLTTLTFNPITYGILRFCQLRGGGFGPDPENKVTVNGLI